LADPPVGVVAWTEGHAVGSRVPVRSRQSLQAASRAGDHL